MFSLSCAFLASHLICFAASLSLSRIHCMHNRFYLLHNAHKETMYATIFGERLLFIVFRGVESVLGRIFLAFNIVCLTLCIRFVRTFKHIFNRKTNFTHTLRTYSATIHSFSHSICRKERAPICEPEIYISNSNLSKVNRKTTRKKRTHDEFENEQC